MIAMLWLGVLASARVDEELPCSRARCAHHALQEAPDEGKAANHEIAASGWPADDSNPLATDVLHYHLDLEIIPSTKTLAGSNRMSVVSLVDGLATFDFRLSDTFSLSSVSVDDVPAEWQRLDSKTIRVALVPARSAGQEFSLHVGYGGQPIAAGLGSIIFSTHAGTSVVYTLSEPDYAYTWWPAKDDNRDKTTADLWFTVPASMVVASNGVLEGVDTLPGKRRCRWATGYPTATYLYCFAATNYNEFGSTWTYDGVTMPLQFFLYPEYDTPAQRAAWLLSADMLTVFSDLFGPYPFIEEKYGIYQFSFGGGMEHQTMTGQKAGLGDWLTAHELAHQWWGDVVTCWPWNDIWLNEGFASYSEALWSEFKPGSSGSPALIQYMLGSLAAPTSAGTVYVESWTSTSQLFDQSTVYRKGAWVLHMLRRVVGDETFFDVLRTYRQTFAYATASTSDFQAVAESVSGRDLDWFFQPWIYEPGAPRYAYGWRNVSAGGKHFVELKVRQIQSVTLPLFAMPIDVRAAGAGPATTAVVWNDAPSQHFMLEAAAPAADVQLDPDHWILRKSSIEEAFEPGPPKVLVTAPPPGGFVSGLAARAIEVYFQQPVSAASGDFTLTGTVFGPIALAYSYDSLTHAVQLIPAATLKPDTYTLAIADSVRDAVSGLALDGETSVQVKAGAPQTIGLPSGDGLPGGSATITFTTGPQGDLDGDGKVDQIDLAILLSAYDKTSAGDLSGDGVTDQFDLGLLLSGYGG
jgi:aminopeptidase N